MKIQLGLLLNLLIAVVTSKESAAYLRREEQTEELETHPRIIATPKNYNLLSNMNLKNREHQILWKGPLRTYHQLKVTYEEEDQLNKTLRFITGTVDGMISENSNITAMQFSDASAVNPVTKYLSDIPRCKTTINDSNFKYLAFIMDGYLNNNNTPLSGMPIKQQFNLIEATPGVLTHGSKVAETLMGGNDDFIQASGVEAIGITVFDDKGRGFISYLMRAASIIHKMIPQLQRQGYIVGGTFSGNSNYSPLFDTVFKELSIILKLLTVSAGNRHDTCNVISPSGAGGNVIPVGGTNNINGIPDSNYNSISGCGDNMIYTPYCATTHSFNPTVQPAINSRTTFCGTSESAPNAHRIAAQYAVACPTCTNEQLPRLMRNYATVSISSSVGPISVFPLDKVCPLDNTELFSSYPTINGKFSLQYNSTTPDGRLCATFRVARGSKNSNSRLLFSVDGTTLSLAGKHKQLTSVMRQQGFANLVVTAQNPNTTTHNNINVFLQTSTGMKSILHAFANKPVSTISLGTKSWNTKISNARKCLLA